MIRQLCDQTIVKTIVKTIVRTIVKTIVFGRVFKSLPKRGQESDGDVSEHDSLADGKPVK